MKKFFTFLTLVVFSHISFFATAQLVTITATHQMPVAGDSVRFVDANTFGFDAAGTGTVTNKVWDFSALMTTGTSVDFVFNDPSTLLASDGKDSFPTATIAKKQSDASGCFYYKNTANNINRIGAYVSPTNYLIYNTTTVATEFHFPITAGGNFSSTYNGNFAPFGVGEDSTIIESGTLSISADMQGQLSLPIGNFNSVLRLHVIESFHMKTYMMGMAIMDNVISDDYYYWFVDTIFQPLVIYGITTVDGTAQTPVLRYQSISSPTSVTNVINSDYLNIYPNPAKDVVTIDLNNKNNIHSEINIYNVMGMLVKSELIQSNQKQINIDDLNNGIYLIEVKSNNKTQKQKLIIER